MEIWKTWLEIFAKDVSAKTLEKYVTNEDCYLWHIFSYGFVNCIQGEAAEKEYMKVIVNVKNNLTFTIKQLFKMPCTYAYCVRCVQIGK